MTRKCTKKDIIENFVNCLPVDQIPFAGTKPYLDLCDAVFAVLSGTADERPEKQQAYYHVRQQFDHFCKFQIEEAEKHIEEIRIEQEERKAKIEQLRLNETSIREHGWGSV